MDPLHDIMDAVRTRLQAELETQLLAVSQRHEEALKAARSRIEEEAEQRFARQLAAARAQLEEEAAATTERVRREMEQAVAAERQLAESRGEAERRTTTDLFPTVSLLRGLREIDAAASVSDSLSAIRRVAAAEAGRVTLFLSNGPQLQAWANDGPAPSESPESAESALVREGLRTRDAVRQDGTACAVPLILDGVPVAVLYGEADPGADTAPDWSYRLEALARHGAARLGYLTALRTAQARRWIASGATNTTDPDEMTASARRYARLVVSEIKLYNEVSVQAGRTHRDLLQRLGPEVDRARRLYEERVPSSVPGRHELFQQELVQTLAGGDASLLG